MDKINTLDPVYVLDEDHVDIAVSWAVWWSNPDHFLVALEIVALYESDLIFTFSSYPDEEGNEMTSFKKKREHYLDLIGKETEKEIVIYDTDRAHFRDTFTAYQAFRNNVSMLLKENGVVRLIFPEWSIAWDLLEKELHAALPSLTLEHNLLIQYVSSAFTDTFYKDSENISARSFVIADGKRILFHEKHADGLQRYSSSFNNTDIPQKVIKAILTDIPSENLENNDSTESNNGMREIPFEKTPLL